MSTQETMPFVKGSATSRDAAGAIRPHADTQRARVFECIQTAGPAGRTDDEIQKLLDMPGDTERPRRVKLVQDGRIKKAGFERRTSAGRPAEVYIVVS